MRNPKEESIFTTVVTIEEEDPKIVSTYGYFFTPTRNGQPYNLFINMNGPVKIHNTAKYSVIRHAPLKIRGTARHGANVRAQEEDARESMGLTEIPHVANARGGRSTYLNL